MRKIAVFLVLLFSFLACKTDKEIQVEKIVTSIEAAGLTRFLNIEYSPSEKIETYNYYRNDSLFTSWDYNLRSNQFEKYDKTKMKIFTSDAENFMTSLRAKIKSTPVVLITQTQWIGKVINYWINDTEVIAYVNPAVKCDAACTASLTDELRNYSKIKDNWYYRKLIVCTNK